MLLLRSSATRVEKVIMSKSSVGENLNFSEASSTDSKSEAATKIQSVVGEREGANVHKKIDRFCYRLIVSSLSGSILLTLIGGLTLSILNKPIPELLIVIGSNAIGAVSGLLAPSPDER